MEWYYVLGNQRVGPVSEAELQALVEAGTITPNSLVWHREMSGWQRYRDARGNPGAGPLQTGSVATAQQGVSGAYVCAECDNVFPSDEIVRYGDAHVCAACKPVFFQRIREGAPLRTTMVYGGFWLRAVAKIIDWLILGAVNWVLSALYTVALGSIRPSPEHAPAMALLFVLLWLLQLSVAAGYTTYFLGKFAATPGKMACGLKVVTSAGDRVSYARAFGRYFAEMLSSLIFCIGYLMAAFDEEKRALHDRICDTRVIKKE